MKKGSVKMAVKPCFAENAMITEDNGTQVKFHPVCPKCGMVMRNTTGSGHCTNGESRVGSFNCNRGCPCFSVILHRG